MKTYLQRAAIGALVITALTMPFSVRLCHWSFLAFVLFWILEGHWTEKLLLIKSNPLSWLMPLFFMLYVTGILYSNNREEGLLQLEKKAAFLLIPLTLVSTRQLSRPELRSVVKAFVVGCTLAAVYCVFHAGWIAYHNLPANNFGDATMSEFVRLNPGASPVWMSFSYIALASGIQIHPTYFGLYLVVCLLFILYFFKSDEVTPLEVTAGKVILVFFLVFIFFLSSRIATICAIGLSMAAAVKLQRSWTRAVKIQAAIIVLFGLIMYINPVSRYRGLQEPAEASFFRIPGYTSTSIEIRLSLLKLSSIAGSQIGHWFGSGTGTAEDRLREAGEANGISNALGSYDPHNQFIYTFLDLGAFGLLSMIAMMVIPLGVAWKKRSMLYAGFTLVFIAVCLTESAFELQKGIVLFTFFGSLLLFHETTLKASLPDTQAQNDRHASE